MTLDHLNIGSFGVIRVVGGEGALRRRLLDMGLTPKTQVYVRKAAPLGDPIEISLRGYELTLRKEDASKIVVEPEGAACPIEPRQGWFKRRSRQQAHSHEHSHEHNHDHEHNHNHEHSYESSPRHSGGQGHGLGQGCGNGCSCRCETEKNREEN